MPQTGFVSLSLPEISDNKLRKWKRRVEDEMNRDISWETFIDHILPEDIKKEVTDDADKNGHNGH